MLRFTVDQGGRGLSLLQDQSDGCEQLPSGSEQWGSCRGARHGGGPTRGTPGAADEGEPGSWGAHRKGEGGSPLAGQERHTRLQLGTRGGCWSCSCLAVHHVVTVATGAAAAALGVMQLGQETHHQAVMVCFKAIAPVAHTIHLLHQQSLCLSLFTIRVTIPCHDQHPYDISPGCFPAPSLTPAPSSRSPVTG